MSFQVDVWLRGTDVATTATLEGITRAPDSWNDDDVRLVLEAMLRAMHRLKHPAESEFPITLRGLSWIVNPSMTAASSSRSRSRSARRSPDRSTSTRRRSRR